MLMILIFVLRVFTRVVGLLRWVSLLLRRIDLRVMSMCRVGVRLVLV